MNAASTILIGYGNPGRQDDGLGPAFADLAQTQLRNITVQSNYQLTVEDAFDIQHYERVIFVDASLDEPQAFSFKPLATIEHEGLGSHTLSPNGVLSLCYTLYEKQPEAYILAIRGYHFDEYEERLSEQAQVNLNAAFDFLSDWFEQNKVHTEVLTKVLPKEKRHA
jgi:hydrogenase maturation protease